MSLRLRVSLRHRENLGACPTLIVLLRRTIRSHLRRARPETILNVFQRIHLRFFRACGLASGAPHSPRHEDNVGQAPANFEAITKNFSKPAPQAAGTSIAPYLAGCSKRPSSKAAANYHSLNSGVWDNTQLRASNEGLPRPRVARARSSSPPHLIFQHPTWQVDGHQLPALRTSIPAPSPPAQPHPFDEPCGRYHYDPRWCARVWKQFLRTVGLQHTGRWSMTSKEGMMRDDGECIWRKWA